MQFLGKFEENRMLAPPGELMPPPQENPGSASIDLWFRDGFCSSNIVLERGLPVFDCQLQQKIVYQPL